MNTKAAVIFKKADQYRTTIMIGIFFLYTVFMQAAPLLPAYPMNIRPAYLLQSCSFIWQGAFS